MNKLKIKVIITYMGKNWHNTLLEMSLMNQMLAFKQLFFFFKVT